jgi:hypothetical protein
MLLWKHKLKKRVAGFSFVGLVLIGVFSIGGAQAAIKPLVSFSGFAHGTTISTKVFTPEALSTSVISISKSGTQGPLPQGDPEKISAYGFKIENEKQSLDFLLKPSQDQKNLTLTASGLLPFSKIILETVKGPQTLYSDWAGIIHEDQITTLSSQAGKPFKIALYSSVMNDGEPEDPHPLLININFAPPGAGTTATAYGPFHHDSVKRNYIHPLQMFAEQISSVAMHYMFAIGTFMDGKEQLETQRDFQQLKAEAHRDYHPSQQMCVIGSFTKSLATTEAKAFNDQEAINSALFAAYRNLRNASTLDGPDVDMENRLQQYREVYCDPQDSNTAMFGLCQHDKDGNRANSILRTAPPGGLGAEKPIRMNKDIDFVRTIDNPLTMNIDFTNNQITDDEEDIMALARNLYWPVPHKKVNDLRDNQNEIDQTKMRSIMAMSSIAHNSFATIIAMKARAPEPTIEDPGWAYMKTMMREFGLEDEEIAQLIGKNPSYFAQMDILTKKMYQNPDFYTNLYDKPVNVSRINASMEAIGLMQGRDHFDAALRREMLFSAMIEEQLSVNTNKIQGTILDTKESK